MTLEAIDRLEAAKWIEEMLVSEAHETPNAAARIAASFMTDGPARLTFNQLGAAMESQLGEARERVGPGPAGRDYALAATHLEDALTRFNSGRYRERGTWKRADPDAAPRDPGKPPLS